MERGIMDTPTIIGLITVAFITTGGIAGVVKGVKVKSMPLVWSAVALIVFCLLSLMPLLLG